MHSDRERFDDPGAATDAAAADLQEQQRELQDEVFDPERLTDQVSPDEVGVEADPADVAEQARELDADEPE